MTCPTCKGLTPRQLEVCGGFSEGLTRADIAALLGISRSVVTEHMGAARKRLGARTDRQAMFLLGKDS